LTTGARVDGRAVVGDAVGLADGAKVAGSAVGSAVAAAGAGEGMVRDGGGLLGAAVRLPHGTVQSPTKVKTTSLPPESDSIMQKRELSELSSASWYSGGSRRE
jgi:hypothetical protein